MTKQFKKIAELNDNERAELKHSFIYMPKPFFDVTVYLIHDTELCLKMDAVALTAFNKELQGTQPNQYVFIKAVESQGNCFIRREFIIGYQSKMELK